jgi:hypothetical protein
MSQKNCIFTSPWGAKILMKQAIWKPKEYCILADDAEYLGVPKFISTFRKFRLPPSSGLYSEGAGSMCLQMLISTHQSARHQVPIRHNSSMSEPSESQIVWTSDGRHIALWHGSVTKLLQRSCVCFGTAVAALFYCMTVTLGRQPYTS